MGEKPQLVLSHALSLINKLSSLGVQMDATKSKLTPTMVVTFLGHHLDLLHRVYRPTDDKLKKAQAAIRKAPRGNTMVPPHLAAAGGRLLDLQKSVQNLLGLPKIVMAAATRRSKHPYIPTPWARKVSFGYLGWVFLK